MQSKSHKATAQACSQCHARKTKCVPREAGCQGCKDSGVQCRLRYPRKLGRPRGAKHGSFRTSLHGTSVSSSKAARPIFWQKSNGDNISPSLRTGIALQAGGIETRNAEVHNNNIGLESATQDLWRPLEKATVTKKARSDVPQSRRSAMNTTDAEPRFGFDDQGFSHGQITTMPSGPSFPSSPNDFANQFPPMSDGSLPTTLSIFTTYVEVHKTLVEIRSGQRDVSISDLKDANGVMGTLHGVSELGNHAANFYSAGVMSQQGQLQSDISCSLFAFTMVLMGCELAEQISLTVLARCGTDPLTASGFVVTSDETKSISESIAGLIRLDFYLSQINRVLTIYVDLIKEQGTLSSVSLAYCQNRLLQLHNQIRSVVDSMSPSWN